MQMHALSFWLCITRFFFPKLCAVICLPQTFRQKDYIWRVLKAFLVHNTLTSFIPSMTCDIGTHMKLCSYGKFDIGKLL